MSVRARLLCAAVAAGTRVLVGAEAKRQQAMNPTSTIFEAKHFIGQRYTPELAALASRFPFRVENVSGNPMFSVMPSEESTQPLLLSPEEIGAKVVTAVSLPFATY